MKAGIYKNTELSNEAYHADPAIGSSGLNLFSECPALYYTKYLDPEREPSPKSAALEFGSAAHLSLLEPELFDKEYAVAPEDIEKKTVKAWKDFEKENKDKTCILWKDFKRITRMTAAIKSHDLANAALSNGVAECSFFAEDEVTGLMMKARPDYLARISGYGTILVDYKTTGISLQTTAQSRHAFNLHRQIQASHHKAVAELSNKLKIDEVIYVVQMIEAPYLIRVFRMPQEAIQIGDDQRRVYLDQMKQCFDDGIWPDYPHEIEDYTIPRWMDYEFN